MSSPERFDLAYSGAPITGDFLDTRNLRSRNPLVNATLSLVLLSGSVGSVGAAPKDTGLASSSPAIDCASVTVDNLLNRGAVEGQPGFVHQDTGFIDENTGEEHPMLVDGYSVLTVQKHTGIIMQNGQEYIINSFEYMPQSCSISGSK